MRSHFRFGCACGLLAAAACGQAQPRLPEAVTSAVTEVAALCIEVGGVPQTERAVLSVDLNRDNFDDFVFYIGSVHCDGAIGVYGDRAKGLFVFAGDGDGGATEVFQDWVYDAAIEGAGVAATLWLTTSGDACGRAPAADFASETFCERALAWSAAMARFEYAPIAAARIIE